MEKKYLVNERNFLISISEGETFKTEYSNLRVNNQDKEVLYKQEFIYRIDEKFIKDNKEILLRLNIIQEVIA